MKCNYSLSVCQSVSLLVYQSVSVSNSVSLSLSKMPQKHHDMYLCLNNDNISFRKTRSNIINKMKQNK